MAGLVCLIVMHLIAVICLPLLAASSFNRTDLVRIGLFGLFKPEMIQVRTNSTATLSIDGSSSNNSLVAGELIQIRLSGARLNVVVVGSHGAAKQSTETGQVVIAPDVEGTLELELPGRLRRIVNGAVSVDAGLAGRGPLRIVLSTNREAAVASVVAAETSRREPEALMALAVVARTFMISHTGRHSNEGFDYCDTTHCQLYRGEQDVSDRATSAVVLRSVVRTAGQVLTFDGHVIEGYYTAVCGGLSATPSMVWGGNGDYPYRRIVCQWCKGSRFRRWQRAADARRVIDSVAGFLGAKLSNGTELLTTNDPGSGFVESVTIVDGSKRFVLSADSFRRAVGLSLGWNTVLSPTFVIERKGSRTVFRGRGFGSQIGLCEEGAIAQAVSGRSYREILGFYFPGAAVGSPRD